MNYVSSILPLSYKAYQKTSGKRIIILMVGIGFYTVVCIPLLHTILNNDARPLQYRFGFTVHEAILYLNDIGEYGRNVSLVLCLADCCYDILIALCFTLILSLFFPAVLEKYQLHPQYRVCNIAPLMLIVISDIENLGYAMMYINCPLSVSFHSGWITIITQLQWIVIGILLIVTTMIIGMSELLQKKLMRNNLG